MRNKRRGRGEGSICLHASGLWRATTPANLGPRKVFYGKSKAEALEKLRAYKPGAADVTRLTVREYLKSWHDGPAKQTTGAAAHRRYWHCIKLRLLPHVGNLPLAKLTPYHVQELYATLERRGEGARNRQMTANVLAGALRHAVRLGLIPHNPALDVPKPRVPRKEMKTWTAEQVRAFLDAAAGDRLHALYVVALATGMRQGELFGLQWPDIGADYLTVQRTLEELSGRLTLKEPKTAASRRRIDLPVYAVEALLDHKRRMLAEGNAAAVQVFCDRDGGFLRQGNVARRSFRPCIEAAGVPRIRFHDLRHTHATLLLAAGENVKVVSERLGHASVEITLNVYGHVLPTMQRAAAEKIDGIFRKSGTG